METNINTSEEQDFLKQLQKQGNFNIEPCNSDIDFGNEKRFAKLELTNEQKIQLDGLMQHIPNIAAAGAMAGAYTVSFPKGLPHTLISLKRGGFGSQIFDGKRIVGSASFNPMLGQAIVYGIFSAMSIITGQFFLARINKELKKINMKLDDILKFLYGNMKAELLAEVKFIKYACDNYDAIMVHESQRIATISSIQRAKKVALKDIDFLMNDFKDKIEGTGSKKGVMELKAFMDSGIKQSDECLDFALELYLMSCLMEVYYAENYEEKYIKYLKKDIEGYVSECNRQRLEGYGFLKGMFVKCGEKTKHPGDLVQCKEKINDYIDQLEPRYKKLCDRLYGVLDVSTLTTQKTEFYYLKKENEDYDIYYKLPDYVR